MLDASAACKMGQQRESLFETILHEWGSVCLRIDTTWALTFGGLSICGVFVTGCKSLSLD